MVLASYSDPERSGKWPDSVQAHICQGGSFTMFGRHEDAVGCFEKAIELEPNSVEAHHNKRLSLAALRLHDQ